MPGTISSKSWRLLGSLLLLSTAAACGSVGSAADAADAQAGDDAVSLDPNGYSLGALDPPGVARVYGGHPASTDSFPAVGRVLPLDRSYTDPNFQATAACTGTLIPSFGKRTAARGKLLLLTAGHCVIDPDSGARTPVDRLVFALAPNGAHSDWIVFHATRISAQLNWPKADAAPSTDIALIDLERISDNSYTPPMDRIYSHADLGDLRSGAMLYTVGYGMQNKNETFDQITSHAMRGAYLTVQGSQGRFFNLLDSDGGTCSGDSGGPTYVRASDGSRRIAAITSNGPDVKCGVKSGEASGYSRAAPYLYGW